MSKVITVLGSTNIDKVIMVPRFGNSGETLSTPNHQINALGGKGLNQGVAVARAGVKTNMITKVGKEFNISENMSDSLLSTDYVLVSETEETGQAYITVSSETGDNIIHIYGGANADLTVSDVRSQTKAIAESDFVIAQLETPVETVIEAFKIAHENGVKTILNPAPMPEVGGLPVDLLELTDIIAPNEHETAILTEIKVTDEHSLIHNAVYYFERGIDTVIVTLGSKGSFYMRDNGDKGSVPAFKTDPVDTTAAGDTFIGAMATRLHANLDNLSEAMLFGSAASSITVSKAGAQVSIPTEEEILSVLK
ncbi:MULTISPECIES: ribokinase [Leuconostoc]|uniref:ribokinase n=1 Tax=Leuconostoc TaxID=1243 RepID=UPI0002193C83|nr:MULTISPECIES: ribokinase [Leuconostoc]GMA66518.1 ribokinase [Leuconostoc gelidum subsp. gelidum]KAA8370239.1 ribokinase [Leuconostoc carnosum]MBZ5944184.1 ribokinase [Leuconostoc gasicomitatum]MBZ5951853.1 ribokinase [Leuconostoc gasicomitatum]MBZ5955144.1 ribokinase [Leuconostoc gasicomitatum]